MKAHDTALAELSAHLSRARLAIVEAWHAAVKSDPEPSTGASLPRLQFHDHVPALLADFESALVAGSPAVVSAVQVTQRGDAAAHGLHRWQQGFDLAEVVRELGRLNECVVAELDRYAQARAVPHEVMSFARDVWARHHSAAVSASAAEYFKLQQLEAASHVTDLESALEALRDLERERALLWQQAAHDLRGNLGVVANATAGLVAPDMADDKRERFLRLLDRNVGTLRHLLDDVTELARLQCGQEQRKVGRVDGAALLRELCDGLRPAAQERSLTLEFDGPATLAVRTDAVKVRRIAQNLVINAIKYTREGGVRVGCGEPTAGDAKRWFIRIADSGPGFSPANGPQLAGAIESATEKGRQASADTFAHRVTHMDGELGDAAPAVAPADSAPGEGLGLSIVKRLCEMLDAALEIESTPGVGTTVRVLLPRDYPD